MTDREKQIEEMAMSIAECNKTTCEDCRLKCNKYITCEILYEKGYRKPDEVTLRLDLGDRSAEEIKQIAEAFNGDIKKQVAKEILQELKFLYKERAKEYTNWDTNKVQAVTLEWLNADLDEFAEEYGVEIKK